MKTPQDLVTIRVIGKKGNPPIIKCCQFTQMLYTTCYTFTTHCVMAVSTSDRDDDMCKVHRIQCAWAEK